MKKIIPILLTAICTTAFAGPNVGDMHSNETKLPKDMIPKISVPNLDYANLFEHDGFREKSGQAPQFAVPFVDFITPGTDGIWERVDINTQRWTLRVSCDNALTMNVGFARYNMPASGSMTITDGDGNFRIRPFTADDNKPHGQLWTPVVPGNEIIIEITVDSHERALVVKGLELTSINAGYRWVNDAAGRGASESCNIDVVCSEGDAWRNEIPSVGVFTLNGYLTCSGVMMNNTAQDQTPYFLTANHCGVTSGSDSSIVVYWNYENSYCRTPGSSDSGGNGDGNFNQFTSGSTHRASANYSDFTLTQLSSNPNSAWGITYAGWSRAGSASLGAGIHHPEAAEKRISIPDTVQGSGEFWNVNWGGGRTAPGSSGSPLFDGNHRVIGQLCCGYSYCWNDDNDDYGRSFYLSWSGSSSSSLGSWLDPLGSDSQTLDTLVPGGGGDPSGACCVGTTCTYVTEADCSANNGAYQGDYVSCTGFPCGGAPEGACCVGENCTVMTQAACGTTGGGYQGDDSTCSAGSCDNGGCEVDYSPDCAGTCFEDAVYTDWTGDGYCDDGSYVPSEYGYGGPAGVPIFLNCDSFNCDGDDCTDCGGGGDPTGACCVGETCSVTTPADCSANSGTYNGDNSSCAGNPCGGGGGECPAGEIEDCNGNCCPDYWVGDGYCDDGTYSHNGIAIFLNCDSFNCDGDDCTDCGGGGDPTGACCVGETCSVTTPADCSANSGTYNGDNSSCAGNPCGGGGGECPADWSADCDGVCFPDYLFDSWVGDTYCDNGAYIPADYGCTECPAGVAMWLNCAEFNCDGGDCADEECDTGGDPTGACCTPSGCIDATETDCGANEWQGAGTVCESDSCGIPCPSDIDGNGSVNVNDLLAVVGNWASDNPEADVNNDGIVDISDLLAVVGAWGPCE